MQVGNSMTVLNIGGRDVPYIKAGSPMTGKDMADTIAHIEHVELTHADLVKEKNKPVEKNYAQ